MKRQNKKSTKHIDRSAVVINALVELTVGLILRIMEKMSECKTTGRITAPLPDTQNPLTRQAC